MGPADLSLNLDLASDWLGNLGLLYSVDAYKVLRSCVTHFVIAAPCFRRRNSTTSKTL